GGTGSARGASDLARRGPLGAYRARLACDAASPDDASKLSSQFGKLPGRGSANVLNEGPPRDFIGYGRRAPRVEWPVWARIFVSLVVNYEGGAERNLLDGDTTGEGFGELSYPMPNGVRDLAAETNFEYGSRVGVWRLLDVFERHRVQTTFF